MIESTDIDDNTPWIKPIAVFDALVISAFRVELPATVLKPLGIKEGDVVEIAYIGEHTNEVTPIHVIVGARNRISLRKNVAALSDIEIGDIATVGILTVYKNRTENLVIVFDPDITPEWNDANTD